MAGREQVRAYVGVRLSVFFMTRQVAIWQRVAFGQRRVAEVRRGRSLGVVQSQGGPGTEKGNLYLLG